MRIFVAGATGLIGRRLAGLLVAEGHHVVGLTRSPERAAWLRALGAVPAVADAHDRAAVMKEVANAAPDVVVHQLTDLSAGDPRANAALRKAGTRNLVDAAMAAHVPRMVAQSIAWAYEPGAAPACEQTPLDLHAPEPRHTTVSGVTALEAAVAEMPEWVVLRYGLLYGPGTWYARYGLYAREAHAGQLGADDNVTSFLHVEDAAEAAAQALSWPSGTVNVCDDEPAPAREWVPAFCRSVGAPPPAEAPPGPRNGWARGADNRHARADLRWQPRHPSWREGFAHL
ncbi:NAD(P)-dependent oxidoreductase [Nonomuraea sp. NPDC050202]|jgi:nucleoside-diphosphate-sugar epimerase|uniref:NAD-dependent epimerase/dehydratase family protein n=1 Tax=Nonomuraea sp. NPDC050202 TaxID=3155035 RepID=UPI0033D3CBF5